MKYEKYIEYLRLADRRERLNLGTKQLFKAVKFALLYIVIIATLDIVFHLTGMQRILLIIVSLFAGSIMVLLWLYKAYIQISRPRSIARSIEDENQKVGSSLINYLDLHEQMENGEMSERTKEINKEVLRQYGLSFKDFDFSKSLVNNVYFLSF